jgi:hypothetical protein
LSPENTYSNRWNRGFSSSQPEYKGKAFLRSGFFLTIPQCKISSCKGKCNRAQKPSERCNAKAKDDY